MWFVGQNVLNAIWPTNHNGQIQADFYKKCASGLNIYNKLPDMLMWVLTCLKLIVAE